MSRQSFERQVAAALRGAEGLWVFHPSDFGAQKQAVPADFIFGHANGWGCLEVKATQEPTLSSTDWSVHQRRAARAVAAAGGRAWLLVAWMTAPRLYAWQELPQPVQRGERGLHCFRDDIGLGRTITDLDELGLLLLS